MLPDRQPDEFFPRSTFPWHPHSRVMNESGDAKKTGAAGKY